MLIVVTFINARVQTLFFQSVFSLGSFVNVPLFLLTWEHLVERGVKVLYNIHCFLVQYCKQFCPSLLFHMYKLINTDTYWSYIKLTYQQEQLVHQDSSVWFLDTTCWRCFQKMAGFLLSNTEESSLSVCKLNISISFNFFSYPLANIKD